MALFSTTPQTRAKAGRIRTISQVAALAAAVAAGGAIGANFLKTPATSKEIVVEVPHIESTKWMPASDASQGKADLEGIGSRMMLVSNSPKIAEAPKMDQAAPVAPPASVRDHVKFLGVVTDGARFLALISVDGKQRIVGVGDVIKLGDQSFMVSSVTADAVGLDDGKKSETIERARQSASSVSHSTAPATLPVTAAGAMNIPGGAGKLLDHRNGGPARAKPSKDLSGMDPKTRAFEEGRNITESREMRRKQARIQLEKETGRSGEELEKILDLQEKEGKFDANNGPGSVEVKKGGK
jgi:hypothetical protein